MLHVAPTIDPDTFVYFCQPEGLFPKRKITLFSPNYNPEPTYEVRSINCKPYRLKETGFSMFMFYVSWVDYRKKSWVPESNLVTVDKSLISLAKNNPGRECTITGCRFPVEVPRFISPRLFLRPSFSLAIPFQGDDFCTLNSIRNAMDRLGDRESLPGPLLAQMYELGPYASPNFLIPLFNSNPVRNWTWRVTSRAECNLSALLTFDCMMLVFSNGHCALVDCSRGDRHYVPRSGTRSFENCHKAQKSCKRVFVDPSPDFPAPVPVASPAELCAMGFGILSKAYWLEPYRKTNTHLRLKKRVRHRSQSILKACLFQRHMGSPALQRNRRVW
jgi:hypothetical protein